MDTQTDSNVTAEQPETESIHTSTEPVFAETLSKLREPLKKDQIKKRPGGKNRDGSKNNFEYIPWHEVAEILDNYASNWNHSIKAITQLGEFVAITVTITIDGISREGIGTGRAADETGIKKAEHDALKRAAVKFGVARELYKKESDDIDRNAGSGGYDFDINNPPANPKASGLGDLVTSKQLGMIRAKGRGLDIDADELSVKHLGAGTEELNKKAASWFIDLLADMERQAKHTTGSAGNVTPIDRGRSSAPVMSPEAKAKMLVDDGNVVPNEGGFAVTDWIQNNEITFQVSFAADHVTCGCGEYKTAANTKGDIQYECPHKAAVRIFTTATAA